MESRTIRLAVIGGDGIGPEVTAEALKVLRAATAGVIIDETSYDLGARRWHSTGETLPDSVLEELREQDVILLGAVGDPTVPSGVLERGLLLRLRFELDHYVNLRPVRLYPGVASPLAKADPIDMLVVREGTEGPYTGAGGAMRKGTAAEIATQESLNTRYGVERVVRFAFDQARRRSRHKLTLVHKTNVLTFAGDLWQRTVDEVAGDYPDIAVDYSHVDAASMFFVTAPDRFDVIVTDNLFGDILTDLGAAIAGGIGLAASGNINPSGASPSMFEPVHGSAPDIAGTGKADPTAAILSAAMLCDHLGFTAAAARIEQAVGEDLVDRQGAWAARTTVEVGSDIAELVAGLPVLVRSRWCHWRRRDGAVRRRGASVMIEFDIRISGHSVPEAQRETMLRSPGFGQVFTDHMVTIRWRADRGWHDARLEPYGPFSLDPATSVFHYAQEFFEGLKAYRQENGAIALFRPDANAARFNASARRMAMPELPEEDFLRALELLITHDRDWVPHGNGNSLYIRPFMIATQRGLGVNHPSTEYLFCVIASPAASYFAGGVKPVTVWLSEDYTRAAPGGTGAVKCGGNYAAAFLAQRQAVEMGCDQVVWLDAAEHRWVEEMGGMNLFFVYQDRLVTPALTGTLLPGITRDSLLRLAPELNLPAVEGRISTDEWREACATGQLSEVFACGTAAVITPVGSVHSAAGDWTIGDGQPGPVTMRLRDELTSIQWGTKPDPFNWIHKVC